MALPLRDFLLALIVEIENASDPGRGDSRAHLISVWRPAGIKRQRLAHVSTQHGSATRTKAIRSQSDLPSLVGII